MWRKRDNAEKKNVKKKNLSEDHPGRMTFSVYWKKAKETQQNGGGDQV